LDWFAPTRKKDLCRKIRLSMKNSVGLKKIRLKDKAMRLEPRPVVV